MSEVQEDFEVSFRSIFSARAEQLLRLARYVNEQGGDRSCFTRMVLGDLLCEAERVEELLDGYGARHNQRWHALRQLVAPIKLFSNVSYTLIHILRFLPLYRLMPVEPDIRAATHRTLDFTCTTVGRALLRFWEQARKLDVPLPSENPVAAQFSEELPDGRLPADRPAEKVASPEESVVYLSTAFLNLSEESSFLHIARNTGNHDYEDLVPDPFSEERLRHLEESFHNLQALYDTRISDSNVENLDDDLPVLRGHISVVFHLLETATAMVHYCERHLPEFSNKSGSTIEGIVDPDELLEALVNYSVAYADRYILEARSLCHRMLRRYSVTGRVTVPVPRYRGFHVRPSTLIAKIVNHYGSEVEMRIDDESYDASMTFDLFRANEKLNARKKRQLANEVSKLRLDQEQEAREDIPATVRKAVQLLFERNQIVIYERDVTVEDMQQWQDESFNEFLVRCLTQLLAQGKIDIQLDMTATFIGDRRVLEDIKLLAENNYGEDDFGNNLPLPNQLAYLRK